VKKPDLNMESQVRIITGLNERGDTENQGRSENEHWRSPGHVENGQQAVTQLNFDEVLLNNNDLSPRQIGQILRALGDELNDAFKFPTRSSKNG